MRVIKYIQQPKASLPVDTVTCDGHKMALGRHNVAQQAQMPVVDVQTVKVEDSGHLLLHALTDGLDAERGEDLANVVGARAHRVYVTLRQYLG